MERMGVDGRGRREGGRKGKKATRYSGEVREGGRERAREDGRLRDQWD